MSGFNSIQIRFKNIKEWQSPLSNTRTVPFVNSYLEVIKSCINDINTEYFWVFPSFMHCKEIEFDFIPEQFEKDQIHVWYTTHPLGGLNKEGHVLLIPTKQFKKQMKDLKFLRDFKDINYHEHSTLWQPSIMKVPFRLHDPIESYNNSENYFYKWIYNRDLNESKLPNFYPSFWEDLKVYSWGKTKDIMLVPQVDDLKQFYDIDRSVDFDLDYNVRVMDIIFISYDEPSAEKRYNELKAKYPRTKWLKNIQGQTMAYHKAANMSDTDYFFAVFPKIEIVDSFKFDFQPDRMKNACHYIFNCKNPVNGLEYGHGAVLLYNKKLTLETIKPSLDFTLSAPHDHVPILSAINHFNQTPWLAWRTAFREVIKLCQMKATVESKYRLKKWCELGTGDNADWVQKGALDAQAYYQKNSDNHEQLMLSYDFKWLKERYETEY
jgi:hypothetical protein